MIWFGAETNRLYYVDYWDGKEGIYCSRGQDYVPLYVQNAEMLELKGNRKKALM